MWVGCGLGTSESGARYRGPDGTVLYVVRYRLETREAAVHELSERLAGRGQQRTPWDVRQVWQTGDVWVAEFNTPFPLSEELDASRWPMSACAHVDGASLNVVYGPTREHVLALHDALPNHSW